MAAKECGLDCTVFSALASDFNSGCIRHGDKVREFDSSGRPINIGKWRHANAISLADGIKAAWRVCKGLCSRKSWSSVDSVTWEHLESVMETPWKCMGTPGKCQ